MSFKVVADSACDLSPAQAEQYNVDIVPFYVSYGDDNYLKEYYELTTDKFYKTLRSKSCTPRTSMPSVEAYTSYFEKSLKESKDILCICLSSALSGSYSGAQVAATQLAENYPDRKIIVIDSTLAVYVEGQLVIEAVRMAEQGFDICRAAEVLEKVKLTGGAILTVENLNYLQHGGRIGKIGAVAGDLLNIKPIIRLSGGDGSLFPIAKVRTRKKTYDKIIEETLEATGGYDSNAKYILLHTDADDEISIIAERFTSMTNYKFAEAACSFGCTIGAHLGPGALGIGYIKTTNFNN